MTLSLLYMWVIYWLINQFIYGFSHLDALKKY